MLNRFIIAIFVAISFYNCSNDVYEPQAKKEVISARAINANNSFIDINDYCSDNLPDSIIQNQERRANITAATVRFLKYLSYDGIHYTSSLSSGDEININQHLFEQLVKMYVTDKNKWIDQMIEYKKNHGDKCKIVMTDVTNPEYQETLLDDRMFYGVIEIK